MMSCGSQETCWTQTPCRKTLTWHDTELIEFDDRIILSGAWGLGNIVMALLCLDQLPDSR
ncbi:hypothetical protein E2C01_016610 [Portunus trituberculatus]|uniref:Uncharacterized protein n=1 Tax=Portunus trituberculatus TaxID=210409 RepID=A0A5B7DQP1_PORTR|nr:hypothetical protein [Portunus trituberculatus]